MTECGRVREGCSAHAHQHRSTRSVSRSPLRASAASAFASDRVSRPAASLESPHARVIRSRVDCAHPCFSHAVAASSDRVVNLMACVEEGSSARSSGGSVESIAELRGCSGDGCSCHTRASRFESSLAGGHHPRERSSDRSSRRGGGAQRRASSGLASGSGAVWGRAVLLSPVSGEAVANCCAGLCCALLDEDRAVGSALATRFAAERCSGASQHNRPRHARQRCGGRCTPRDTARHCSPHPLSLCSLLAVPGFGLAAAAERFDTAPQREHIHTRHSTCNSLTRAAPPVPPAPDPPPRHRGRTPGRIPAHPPPRSLSMDPFTDAVDWQGMERSMHKHMKRGVKGEQDDEQHSSVRWMLPLLSP